QWYFSKDDLQYTPSVADGMTVQQEQLDRTKGCLYLLAIAAKLNLPQLVVSTACTFFHRFFMRQSMTRFHVYDIAATSLFVATKVEECTRRIKDIIFVCSQKAAKNDKLHLAEDSKQKVGLHITFLLNSLGVPLCLLYRPKIIAAAALILAWHFSDEDPPSDWWETIGVEPGQVTELAVDMLDYCDDHYAQRAPPTHQQHHHHHQHQQPYHQQKQHHNHHCNSSPHSHHHH
ncbi:cyclin-like protein, partial [Zychaea mexicana]|uniref:cyclin-like protein n=1 Tax=Zychaea mexicana TaxID=64656 RepID=UPI0022FDB3AD